MLLRFDVVAAKTSNTRCSTHLEGLHDALQLDLGDHGEELRQRVHILLVTTGRRAEPLLCIMCEERWGKTVTAPDFFLMSTGGCGEPPLRVLML